MGPVSISNSFSSFAKSMTATFVKANFYNYEYAELVKPRNEFKYKIDKAIDLDVFVKDTKNNFGKFDRFIQDIEPDFRTPVLLKKIHQPKCWGGGI